MADNVIVNKESVQETALPVSLVTMDFPRLDASVSGPEFE